ncbi:chitobiase/beta-hexosaminidase C-terminal domain-containing protein [Turneriella parva]|uniref:Delta-60 repeat-containing protein n=1 Tax=Turneriella parva (strain ATCC BAA-1111 / DSM 21527 / NCTC 11395 / H) TaxID=869212 RepID=I4B0A6_TURPD|nr:chitobiase/beta-hexosaminidase C-terminal domain-containing protein [Turneriella parva]AFM10713.1 Delta-60 repeat-containing protein [Turneriella parva DSM 21527]
MKKTSQVLISIILVFLSCNRLEKINQTFLPPEESTAGTTVGGPDTIAPSIVTGISFTGIGSDTITINWGAASDNVDLPAALQYKLVKDDSSAANILSVTLANAKTGADLLMDWTSNVTLHTANGLAPLATYYFVVLVRDVAGNIGLYSPASQSTTSLGTLVSPEFSPVAATYSTGQNIAISSSNNAGGNICYTTDGNFPAAATPGTCSFGTQIANGATVNISAGGSTILRAMATRVGATNSSISSGTYTIDFPPVAGTAITFSNITQTSVRVNWGAASDAITATASLQYKLVKDDTSAANINSVALANAKSGSDLVMNWTSGTTSRTVTGLNSGATFHFAVLVRDGFGNMILYAPASQKLNGGIIDATFNPGSSANVIQSLAIQTDGKIIIGGLFTAYNGISRNRIARVNADGTLDLTFNPGTGANNSVYSMAIQSDGKILIGGGTFFGGGFTTYDGTPRSRIARINTDGSLDISFDPGTGADNSIMAIIVQPDGKIVIGGFFTSYNGTARNRIARLNADGSLDTSFNPGSGADNPILAMGVQPDGKILISGTFANYNGVSRNRIARINSDGSLDTTLAPGSGISTGGVFSMLLQTDGKIVLAGSLENYQGVPHFRILRILPDGNLDSSFATGSGFDSTVLTMALQPDGKLLFGGGFTTYNGTGRNRIARLNPDGSIDTTFVVGTGLDSSISSMGIQPDGKIVIGGSFTSYNSTSINYLARIIQ